MKKKQNWGAPSPPLKCQVAVFPIPTQDFGLRLLTWYLFIDKKHTNKRSQEKVPRIATELSPPQKRCGPVPLNTGFWRGTCRREGLPARGFCSRLDPPHLLCLGLSQRSLPGCGICPVGLRPVPLLLALLPAWGALCGPSELLCCIQFHPKSIYLSLI